MKKEDHKIKKNTTVIHTEQTALRVHRHTLIEMNRSVYTARRNVGYRFFVDFLNNIHLENDKKERILQYQEALQKVEQILSDTVRSQIVPDSPLIKCLKVLHCTLIAVEALLEYEISLASEVEILSKEFDSQDLTILNNQGQQTMNEASVLDAIMGLIAIGTKLLEKDYEERRVSFTEDDFRRYDKAYQEYEAYFKVKGLSNA